MSSLPQNDPEHGEDFRADWSHSNRSPVDGSKDGHEAAASGFGIEPTEVYPPDTPVAEGGGVERPSWASASLEHAGLDPQRGEQPVQDPPVLELPSYEPANFGPPNLEPPSFRPWPRIEYRAPERIPNFGHFGLLLGLLFVGLLCAGLLTRLALAHHLFGVSSVQRAIADIHYTLGSEAILYVVTFVLCLLIFPLFWHKSFFAGVQWNGATALRLRLRLVSVAFVCFLFALVSGEMMPGPSNAPIDKIFRAPGAAWLLFIFGVTFAPFFEEMFFRGFLLPALSTAFDWLAEKLKHLPVRPLAENGHPRWSFSAMAAASVATSIPFALLHGAQTGYAVGPFFLLVGVSMVLCAVRLSTRSLAASVLVHASYNFMLFALMLAGTGGFRHLQRM